MLFSLSPNEGEGSAETLGLFNRNIEHNFIQLLTRVPFALTSTNSYFYKKITKNIHSHPIEHHWKKVTTKVHV